MDPEQVPLRPLLLPLLWGREPCSAHSDTHTIQKIDGKWMVKSNIGTGKADVYWVPELYRNDVMRAYHLIPTAAHPSERKMHTQMKGEVWWRGMLNDVQEFVKRCHRCQLMRNNPTNNPPIQQRRNASHPMQRVSLDVLSLRADTLRGPHLLLVVMDEFSRYAETYPMTNESAEKVANLFFRKFVTRYGIPEEIVTDRGSNFMSELFTRLCTQLEIRKLHTTAYRPQGNGGNERMHSTLYSILRMLPKRNGDWRERLPLALYVYRNTVHKALGMSPFRALFGYARKNVTLEHYHSDQDQTLDERIEELQQMHRQIKEHFDTIQENRNEKINRTRKLPEFKPGDLVKVRIHERQKLEPVWEGPAEVIRQVGPVDYEVAFEGSSRRHPVVHVTYMKPFFN